MWIKLYPYGLESNPYPDSNVSHVPAVFGGNAHKEARKEFLSSLESIHACTFADGYSEIVNPLFVINEDAGRGKTHLALNMKETAQNVAVSYLDLSQFSRKEALALAAGALSGF